MNKRTIQSKITTREVLAPLVAQWRSEGKIVGFTSGSFDIIHENSVFCKENNYWVYLNAK